MSFNKSAAKSSIAKLPVSISEVSKLTTGQGASIFDTGLRRQLASIGLQSVSEQLGTSLDQHAGIWNTMPDGTHLEERQREAATRTALMYADGNEMVALAKSVADFHGLEVGLQSFTAEKMNSHRDVSIALAIAGASTVTSAGEAIYPTVDQNMEYTAVRVELPRAEMISSFYHEGSGEQVTKFDRKHLADAARITGMLGGDDFKLKPRVVTGSNENLFVDPVLSPYVAEKDSRGNDINVGAIKYTQGLTVNLLTLCRAKDVDANNKLSWIDRIEDGVTAEAAVIRMGTNGTADTYTKANLFSLSLGSFIGRQFSRLETSSSMNERLLNFRGEVSFTIPDGSPVPEVAALYTAGYRTMLLKVDISSSINLHDGSYTQNSANVVVSGLYKADDTTNYVTDAAAAITALGLAYINTKLDLSFSTRSLRLTGLRVGTRSVTKLYNLTARRPITSDKEVSAASVDDELAAMNMARRLNKESDAITTFMSVVGRIATEYGVDGKVKPDPESSTYAGAYYLTQAWAKVETKTVSDIVKEDNTLNRIQAISTSIVSLLAENFSQAMTASGLPDVVREYAGSGARIVPQIVAYGTLARYCKLPASETKLFGSLDENIFAEPQVVSTSLDAYKDCIAVIPRLTGGDNVQGVLGFGQCIEVSPIVYDVPLDRDGGTSRHLQLQPFYEFITHVPVVYMLKLTGVAEYLAAAPNTY